MKYQQAYKIAHEVSEFFGLNFDGNQKAQLALIILNNIDEAAELGLHGTGYTPCAECGETTAEFLCKKCGRELSARP